MPRICPRVGRPLLLATLFALAPPLTGCRSRAERRQASDDVPPPVADVDSLRRQARADLKAPAESPPGDAEALPHGGRWRLVRAGLGAPPGPEDTVHAKLSIWKGDGSLAYTSVDRGGEVAFPLRMVPSDLVPAFTRIRPGGVAQFWLPREFVEAAVKEGRKPTIVPVEDVRLEYEVVSFDAPSAVRSAVAPVAVAGTAASLPAPDASGPPANAASGGPGVQYVVLRTGAGATNPKPDSHVQMVMSLWQVQGVLVDGPTTKEIATTPRRAPAALAKIVATVHQGDAVRVWLSAARARETFPTLANGEVVCDLAINAIAD